MRFGNIGKLLMFFVLLYRFRFLFYPRKYGVKASFAFGVRCGSRAGARRHSGEVSSGPVWCCASESLKAYF